MDEEGSQQYPFPFQFFYPSRGNFIGFVGNLSSRRLVRRAVASFRRHASVPAEWAAVQDGSPGSAGPIIGRSGSRAIPP